jgi:hypothetical protein
MKKTIIALIASAFVSGFAFAAECPNAKACDKKDGKACCEKSCEKKDGCKKDEKKTCDKEKK